MASNVNITKGSPEDYRDNPVRLPTAGYAHPDREYQPPVEVADWRVVLARVVAALIGYIIYSLWKTGYCWSGVRYGQCEAIAAWEPNMLIGGAVLGGILLAWHYAAKIQIVQAQAHRTNLVLDRYRNPMPADLFSRMDSRELLPYIMARYAMDTKLELETAEWKRLWSVNTLSGDGQTSISTSIAPMLDSGDAQSGPKMLPSDEWLDWFDTRPHGLLAAETGGGKSTLFKVIAKSRIERGELLFLLDPHSSDWFGLPAIGGGEDWETIWCGMQVVIAEYKVRLAERDAYLQQYRKEKPVEEFQRITVLLDEANTACQKLSHGTKRGEESRWDQFAQALGSGARKVGISVQLLAQSPNVEDLNLSGPMLNNFTRICLDARTALMLINQSGGAAEYKRELAQAIEGQEYPAATTIKGKVVLLDRAGLDRIGPPRNPQASLWTEGYDRAEQLISAHQQPAQRVVAASAQPITTVRASVPPSPPPVLSTRSQIAWYAANTDLSTRTIRERLGCDYNLVVDIAGKVRGPAGAALREQYQRIM